MNQSQSSSIYLRYYYITRIFQFFAIFIFVPAQSVTYVDAKVDCAKECPCGGPSLEVPDQWLEVHLGSFKVWHIIFIIMAIIVILVIVYCCFHRCRIPRTKQEIEADSMRSDYRKKFRDHLDELTLDQTSFLDALKKVQQLEETKLEHEVEDGRGARKRLGWLKMLGKVDTPNKEDSADMDNRLKPDEEEKKGRLLAALSDPKNMTHLSKVESKDADKLISAMIDGESVDGDNNHEHREASSHQEGEGEVNSTGAGLVPEDSHSIKELRMRKGRGDKLSKVEKKRLNQADKDIKRSRKEAERLEKLERKLHIEKEIRARKEAKEKQRLELIELKNKEKAEKLEEERLLKEERKMAKKAKKSAAIDHKKIDQNGETKNSGTDKSADGVHENTGETSRKNHKSGRPDTPDDKADKHADKRRRQGAESKTSKRKNKSSSPTQEKRPKPERSKHRKESKKSPEPQAENDAGHHRDERSKSRRRQEKLDERGNVIKESHRDTTSPDTAKHHGLSTEPRVDRKSKQEEIREILNLPQNIEPAQSDTIAAQNYIHISMQDVRLRARSQTVISKSHNEDGSSKHRRSSKDVNQEQAQSLNRDIGRHHSYHAQAGNDQIEGDAPIKPKKPPKEEIPETRSKSSSTKNKPHASSGRVAPVVDEPESTPAGQPQSDEIERIVTPTRFSKMVGRRLILDAATTRKNVSAESSRAGMSSGGHHHLAGSKGDRSKLKKRAPARGNQDDVTIEITNPEMREIYETRIQMD